MKLKKTIIILITLLLISSCSFDKLFMSVLEKPKITFDSVNIKNVTFEKTELDFIYIVDNPNKVGLDYVFMDYEVFLKDRSILKSTNMKYTIKANAETKVKVPIEINFVDFFHSIKNLTNAIIDGEKTIDYRMETKFRVNMKLLKFNIPVVKEGELPLPKIDKNSLDNIMNIFN